jgi:hypothetical protein
MVTTCMHKVINTRPAVAGDCLTIVTAQERPGFKILIDEDEAQVELRHNEPVRLRDIPDYIRTESRISHLNPTATFKDRRFHIDGSGVVLSIDELPDGQVVEVISVIPAVSALPPRYTLHAYAAVALSA